MVRDQYKGWRRVKGDGNCFYRSFIFGYFEALIPCMLKDGSFLDDAIARIHKLYIRDNLFKNAGFDHLVMDEFIEAFDSTLWGLSQACKEGKEGLGLLFLVETLNGGGKDAGVLSNSLVVYFRMIASAFMRVNAEDFAPFLGI